MDTKYLQLVTFEQAVRLKRSGFDWECDHLYVGDMYVRVGGVHFPLDRDVDSYSNWNDGVEKEWISAPTVAFNITQQTVSKIVNNKLWR
jgi:hypothetical protein